MQADPRGRGGQGGRALTLCMCITQSLFPHVAQPDGALAAAVDKLVTANGMEDGGSDDLCQLLHVSGLDVHNILERGGRVKEKAMQSWNRIVCEVYNDIHNQGKVKGE